MTVYNEKTIGLFKSIKNRTRLESVTVVFNVRASYSIDFILNKILCFRIVSEKLNGVD